MKNNLMTHVVAGYPTYTECLQLIMGMQTAGAHAIEVQVPFSDPSADGPVIMAANEDALSQGMTMVNCFKLIDEVRKNGLDLPVYIMSYANKVYSFGFEAFCEQAKNRRVTGLIIPDLPYESVEYTELSQSSHKHNVDLVPVLSPGIADDRLLEYCRQSSRLIYVTTTKGITGNALTVTSELVGLLKKIKSTSSCDTALGFGIRNSQDVRDAMHIADIAVIGSVVCAEIKSNGINAALQLVDRLVRTEQLD